MSVNLEIIRPSLEDIEDVGSESFVAGYAAQLRFTRDRLGATGGIAGRANLSDGDPAEDSMHQVVLGVDYTFGAARPGIRVRVPLDSEIRELAGWMIGVSQSYRVR